MKGTVFGNFKSDMKKRITKGVYLAGSTPRILSLVIHGTIREQHDAFERENVEAEPSTMERAPGTRVERGEPSEIETD